MELIINMLYKIVNKTLQMSIIIVTLTTVDSCYLE